MGAADFNNRTKQITETVQKELVKNGKPELPKVVSGSVTGDVSNVLNEVVSDFKSKIGALTSGFGALSGFS
mgnify:CR=1 FL=1